MGSAIKTLRYVYDSRGNRKALVDHDGGRFTYTYDAVNRISQVQNPQGDRTSYSYDDAGRRTLKRMANGTRASFSYDPAGNLTGLYNLKTDGTVLSSFDYAYDKVGNRTAVREADGSRVTWSYDNTYQLTGEHRTGTSPYRDTYTYDNAGNRLLKIHDGARTTSTYDAANQLTYSQDVSGRTTYTFDADGNQQVVRAPSGERTTYVWDYENRMTSVRLPAGIRNTMAYDADGLRVKLEESTGTKKFVWDDQNYLAETDAANDTQVVYTNEPRRAGNVISLIKGAGSEWLHYDAVGSSRQMTNEAVESNAVRIYDAFGTLRLSEGAAELPFGFIGQQSYYSDSDSRAYLRQRHYLPSIGAFLSCDPLGPFKVYGYAASNPIMYTDPLGLAPMDPSVFTDIGITIGGFAPFGAEVTLFEKQWSRTCCTANGVFYPRGLEREEFTIGANIGFGVGFNVRVFKRVTEFVVKLAEVELYGTGTCVSRCNVPLSQSACCCACGSVAIDISPFSETSIGLFGFSVTFDTTLKGELRWCYSYYACPSLGWSVGFCGEVSATLEFTGSLSILDAGLTGGTVEDDGCWSFIGTEAGLTQC